MALQIPMHITDYIETVINVLQSESSVQWVFKSKKLESLKMHIFECFEFSQPQQRQDCGLQEVFSNNHQRH